MMFVREIFGWWFSICTRYSTFISYNWFNISNPTVVVVVERNLNDSIWVIVLGVILNFNRYPDEDRIYHYELRIRIDNAAANDI